MMTNLEIPEIPIKKEVKEEPNVEIVKIDPKVQELTSTLANLEFLTNPALVNLSIIQRIDIIAQRLEAIEKKLGV